MVKQFWHRFTTTLFSFEKADALKIHEKVLSLLKKWIKEGKTSPSFFLRLDRKTFKINPSPILLEQINENDIGSCIYFSKFYDTLQTEYYVLVSYFEISSFLSVLTLSTYFIPADPYYLVKTNVYYFDAFFSILRIYREPNTNRILYILQEDYNSPYEIEYYKGECIKKAIRRIIDGKIVVFARVPPSRSVLEMIPQFEREQKIIKRNYKSWLSGLLPLSAFLYLESRTRKKKEEKRGLVESLILSVLILGLILGLGYLLLPFILKFVNSISNLFFPDKRRFPPEFSSPQKFIEFIKTSAIKEPSEPIISDFTRKIMESTIEYPIPGREDIFIIKTRRDLIEKRKEDKKHYKLLFKGKEINIAGDQIYFKTKEELKDFLLSFLSLTFEGLKRYLVTLSIPFIQCAINFPHIIYNKRKDEIYFIQTQNSIFSKEAARNFMECPAIVGGDSLTDLLTSYLLRGASLPRIEELYSSVEKENESINSPLLSSFLQEKDEVHERVKRVYIEGGELRDLYIASLDFNFYYFLKREMNKEGVCERLDLASNLDLLKKSVVNFLKQQRQSR